MKRVYISQYSNKILIEYLSASGYSPRLIPPGGRTYAAVDAHPDLYLCKMGVTRHARIFQGDPQELGAAYPDNIRFNAVCLDNYLIHHIKHTSPALLREAQETGLALIHVRQGYTKCSCVVVDGHSLITSDEGICRTLRSYPDIDVLKIRPGFVRLNGLAYGFLGGASGRVGHEVIFNGDLSAHPDFEAIRQFIQNRGLRIQYFPDYPLTDIGSILADF